MILFIEAFLQDMQVTGQEQPLESPTADICGLPLAAVRQQFFRWKWRGDADQKQLFSGKENLQRYGSTGLQVLKAEQSRYG